MQWRDSFNRVASPQAVWFDIVNERVLHCGAQIRQPSGMHLTKKQ